jgi:hypothetical protein
MSDSVQAEHRAERFAHALYGLIIITAVLVAEQQHVADATDALGLLVGTAVVLLLVHTYTAVMAVRLVEGHRLGGHGRRLVALDNAPVLAGVVLPVVAFILAEAGVLTLSAAFRISIVFCLLTLAGLGFHEGQVNGLGWSRSTISAAAAGGIGLVMVLVEAAFD